MKQYIKKIAIVLLAVSTIVFFFEKIPNEFGLFYRVGSVNVEYLDGKERITLYRRLPFATHDVLYFAELDGFSYYEEERNNGAYAKFNGEYHHPFYLLKERIISPDQLADLRYKFRVEETVVYENESDDN